MDNIDNSEKFRSKLVEMVKASGQEIIDRAEDLVGKGDYITNLDINVRLSEDGFTVEPIIEVTRGHLSVRCLEVHMNKEDNDD